MLPVEVDSRTALVVVDMQRAIDDPIWARDGGRNNGNAEIAALRLIEAWRCAGRPIFHVRHDSVEPQSTYRPGQPGHEFKPGFGPRDGEAVVAKHTGSAFVETGLEAALRSTASGIAVAGVITNNSVEATVRHAGTLGFRVMLAEDACFTFARRDWFGVLRTADEVHAMSLANLDGEYCSVVTSAEVLAAAGSPRPILPYFGGPAACQDWDPRVVDAARCVMQLIRSANTEHIGSTAVPGCPGKGVIDLMVTCSPGALDAIKRELAELGFQPQCGRDPFSEDRPMRIGAVAHGGSIWRIHAHVIAEGAPEAVGLRRFRDCLRADRALMERYAAAKRAILARGITDTLEYCYAKGEFIEKSLAQAAG